MKYFGDALSVTHKELAKIIRKPDQLAQSKELFLSLHNQLNLSDEPQSNPTEIDALFSDLKIEEYRVMPGKDDETIAWIVWHLARIEDLTMNYLVARRPQLFNAQWQAEIHSPVTDTGNAMNDDEIMELSRTIDPQALLRYRQAVKKNTQEIVRSLSASDMKRMVETADLQAIQAVGGVTEAKESIWLLAYWGSKDVAGLLLMPPTRHAILHLNDIARMKETIRTKKKYFRRV